MVADMNTYDPVPTSFNTFKKYSTMPKQTKKSETKIEIRKPVQESRSPGPGQYQMINAWKGKEPLPRGSLTYLNSISQRSSPSVYYS
jgi:hypothetical protein